MEKKELVFRVGAHEGNNEALDLDGAAQCGHLATVTFLLNSGAQANQAGRVGVI